MDPAPIYHQAHKYIETASGNKVSKLSTLAGSQNIILNGKTIIMEGCILRGDLATLKIGKNSIIREGAILRPPFKKFAKGVAFFPLHMGEYVYVGENSIINSAQIGSYVHIGKDCVLGRLTMLKDCCAILDGTVLPPDTVVPPFAVFAGNPGRQVGELPEITQELMIDFTWSFYRNMLPMSKKPKEDEGNTPR